MTPDRHAQAKREDRTFRVLPPARNGKHVADLVVVRRLDGQNRVAVAHPIAPQKNY